MTTPDETHKATAQHILEVLLPLLHGVNSEIRASGDENFVISMSQFRALAYLRAKTATLNDIARWQEVSPATLSRMVTTLVERGWVERETDADDRRKINLRLTPSGLVVFEDIGMRTQEHLATALTELTSEELETVEKALNALARIAAVRRGRARMEADGTIKTQDTSAENAVS